jgi:cytochrome c oxidase subunit 1
MRLKFFVLAALALAAAVILRVAALAGAGTLQASHFVTAYLLVLPGLMTTYASLALPKKLGAERLAFPRAEWAAFVAYAAGIVLGVVGLAMGAASMTEDSMDPTWLLFGAYDAGATDPWVVYLAGSGIAVGLAVALTSFNVLASIHTLRGEGVSFADLAASVWGLYAQALVAVVAAPVLVITMVLAIAERSMGLGLFTASAGGDPLLFHHLFWFAMHPLLMTSLLPTLGIALELVGSDGQVFPATLGQRRAFVLFALLSPLAWGQHMVSTGASAYSAMVFSAWALVSLAPLIHLVIGAVRTFGRGTPSPGAMVMVGGVLLSTAGLLALALGAGTLSVAVGLDVVLFGPLGLDLLKATALALLVYTAIRAGLLRLPLQAEPSAPSPAE